MTIKESYEKLRGHGKPCPYMLFLFLCLSSCSVLDPLGILDGDENSNGSLVREIGGNPSAGSQTVYETADLGDLCLVSACAPDYGELPSDFVNTDNQENLSSAICDYDYDPNQISTFVLNRIDGSFNGLELLLSKEDLFFIAWVSVRQKINPYFLMGILSQESAGNCAAVSPYHGEGCFQITNTFGQGQLEDSYSTRTSSWTWSDRNDDYYPDNFFINPSSYFEETPSTDQFRITTDPTSGTIDGEEISSIVNFHFGAIGAGLYFKWQENLLYHHYEDLRTTSVNLFQSDNGKVKWQAAAYNGGAYGSANALADRASNFLEAMPSETQNYVPAVIDYCQAYQAGELTYSASYTEDDVEWIIDLLSYTYPNSYDINWASVKDQIHQIFFADGTKELTFVDDVKALVYVISTYDSVLAPEWPSLE